MMREDLFTGDALSVLRGVASESFDCCVTSPPYWGLRDYGVAGQIGFESTPQEWCRKLTEVFREVRRVMKRSGVLWLNLGDVYATGAGHRQSAGGGYVGAGSVYRMTPLPEEAVLSFAAQRIEVLERVERKRLANSVDDVAPEDETDFEPEEDADA